MSQITRCPACATSFKVVADQLRISQGWVRCGQCKEVFDASAHLLPATPAPLLPDVSLVDTRPPPAPVARKAVVEQAWGADPPAPSVARPPSPGSAVHATSAASVPAVAPAFQLFPPSPPDSVVHEQPPPAEAGAASLRQSGSSGLSAPALDAGSVLEVPQPAVPAFLSAQAESGAAEDHALRLPGLKPFAWNPSTPAVGGAGAQDVVESTQPPAPASVVHSVVAAAPAGGAVSQPPATVLESALPGYELPFAQLREDEDLPVEPMAPMPGLEYPALDAEAVASSASAAQEQRPEPQADAASGVPLPPVEYPQPEPEMPQPPAGAPAMALVEDSTSPAAVLRPSARKPLRSAPTPKGYAEQEDGEEEDSEQQQVSFVVAARRKAFWRKPAVRGALALVLLLSVLGLALQIALQERDRLVAMDPRAKPWLAALCARLHCEIAPQRQIADVVIDSSSFNKARGDSYQLALTIKSRAAIPLAMPAVELTLTDVQDQPVLRRVLLPADLGAPSELPARGEWSSSLSVLVTTGGARVAGYRLLAFYP